MMKAILLSLRPFLFGLHFDMLNHVLVAAPTMLIADEAALKAVYECKGASGTLPCALCSNLVSQTSELDGLEATLVPWSVDTLERCRVHSDESVSSSFAKCDFFEKPSGIVFLGSVEYIL